jgi:hypothetical protein
MFVFGNWRLGGPGMLWNSIEREMKRANPPKANWLETPQLNLTGSAVDQPLPPSSRGRQHGQIAWPVR